MSKYKFEIEDEVLIIPFSGSYGDLGNGCILDRRIYAGSKPEYYIEWYYGNLTWEWETILQYDPQWLYNNDFMEKISDRMT